MTVLATWERSSRAVWREDTEERRGDLFGTEHVFGWEEQQLEGWEGNIAGDTAGEEAADSSPVGNRPPGATQGISQSIWGVRDNGQLSWLLSFFLCTVYTLPSFLGAGVGVRGWREREKQPWCPGGGLGAVLLNMDNRTEHHHQSRPPVPREMKTEQSILQSGLNTDKQEHRADLKMPPRKPQPT